MLIIIITDTINYTMNATCYYYITFGNYKWLMTNRNNNNLIRTFKGVYICIRVKMIVACIICISTRMFSRKHID